jgi:hypothetical protein
VNLIRDVLDKQLIDRRGGPIGRADGIVVEIRNGSAPRILYLETGPVTAARRISPRWGMFVARWIRRFSQQYTGAFRIPWSALRSTGKDVRLDIEAEQTPTATCEKWVREHIIARIPGA